MDKFWPKGLNINPKDPIFKTVYEMIRKRKCECGYNDMFGKSNASNDQCPVTEAFGNHVIFPSLEFLPKYDESKELFYDQENGTPKFHWCFIMELHEKLTPKVWGCYSLFGEKCVLRFENDEDEKPITFSWSDLKVGNTVAVLYAEKHKHSQIKEESLDSIYIFKSNVIDLINEAKLLLEDADRNAQNEKSACFGCNMTSDKLNRCGSCKLARYCSRECQSKCWKESHKKLCSQNATLLKLVCLPRHKFVDHFVFEPDQPNSLPDYVFKPEFVQHSIKEGETKEVEIKPDADAKCGLCGLKNQNSFLKKGKPLTKTLCCKNWICDDGHTYVVGSFERNSCYRNHERYTICGNHFNQEHKGRWQDCRRCKNEISKIDYIYNSTNEYNFSEDKLDIKNRITVYCENCSFRSDNLNSFAGRIQNPGGEIKYYCKNEICKKKAGLIGPDNSFLVQFKLR